MKQPEDQFTVDAFEKRLRGRPRKPNALTGAQRQKAYRERLKQKEQEFSSQRYGKTP